MSLGVGIHQISAAEYHADPCETPSLSASVVNILLDQSPLHAKAAHPRLTENPVREEARHLDLGSLAHSLLLEGINSAVIIDADNYRTKAAQEQRDEARAAGKHPILAREVEDVAAMLTACREQLDRHTEASDAFTGGKPEQALVWKEGDIFCRARLDWVKNDYLRVFDYKTTSGSANPADLSRAMCRNGWDVQARFYCRGIKALTGVDPDFFFVCQETFAPYAISVIGLSPSMKTLGDEKCNLAIKTWTECLSSNHWQGYAERICYAELSAWDEQQWLEKISS